MSFITNSQKKTDLISQKSLCPCLCAFINYILWEWRVKNEDFWSSNTLLHLKRHWHFYIKFTYMKRLMGEIPKTIVVSMTVKKMDVSYSWNLFLKITMEIVRSMDGLPPLHLRMIRFGNETTSWFHIRFIQAGTIGRFGWLAINQQTKVFCSNRKQKTIKVSKMWNLISRRLSNPNMTQESIHRLVSIPTAAWACDNQDHRKTIESTNSTEFRT
jgi:hypothetical protein